MFAGTSNDEDRAAFERHFDGGAHGCLVANTIEYDIGALAQLGVNLGVEVIDAGIYGRVGSEAQG